MTILLLILCLTLTWWPASSWVRLLLNRDMAGYGFIVAGYGLLAGLLVTTLLMRLAAATGIDLSFAAIALMLLGLGVVGEAVNWARRQPAAAPQARVKIPLSRWQRLVIGFLLLLILLRFLSLALEVVWRPVFPWDATIHWAIKAKVWLEHQTLVPFVSQEDWLAQGRSGAYTVHLAQYPETIPLLQTWAGLAVGGYHPSLINLPWLAMYAGMGMAFYGQARNAGIGAVVACAGSYLLLSMPLLNTHVALAGYADLMLGACYLAAMMALHSACTQPAQRVAQGSLALLFGAACLLIKNEGVFWFITILSGMFAAALPRRLFWPVLLGCGVLGITVLALFPQDLAIAGHSLAQLDLQYRPQAWTGIISSLLLLDSWHLLPWFALLLITGYWLNDRSGVGNLTGIGTALALALALFLTLYLGTGYAGGAIRLTAVSRTSLQLLPTVLYLCLLLYQARLTPRPAPTAYPDNANPPHPRGRINGQLSPVQSP